MTGQLDTVGQDKVGHLHGASQAGQQAGDDGVLVAARTTDPITVDFESASKPESAASEAEVRLSSWTFASVSVSIAILVAVTVMVKSTC